MTLEELRKLYAQKGATEKRYTDTEQGRTEDYIPVQYGDGWTAFENDNRKIIGYEGSGMDAQPIYDDAPKTLGGFSKQEGDYITDYDLNGNPISRRKWNESDLKTMWEYLGPVAMGALTMGGGAGVLGNSLFGLTGTAASGAGGALAGGFNAAMTDQDILKGALLGGAAGAGAMKLGDTGLTLRDATSAVNAIKNKDALSLLSSASGLVDTGGIDFGGMSAKDIAKYVNIAKGLSGGGTGAINAIASLSKDAGFNNLMSSLGGFNADPNDFTEGYFLPGGEGYIDPMSKTQGVSGPGYYNEITGEYIKNDLGGLQNPLGPEVGNLDPNQTWEYSLTKPGVWTNDKGESIDLSYLPNTEKVMTGAEIMAKAGASPSSNSGKGRNVATPANSIDLAKLLSLLGQGGQQVVQVPSQDPYANIKSLEELFGTDIEYKLRPVAQNTVKRT